jgi:hypothetical protein
MFTKLNLQVLDALDRYLSSNMQIFQVEFSNQ